MRMYRSFMIVVVGKQITLPRPNAPKRRPRMVSGPIAAHAVAVSYPRCTSSPTSRFAPPIRRILTVLGSSGRSNTRRTISVGSPPVTGPTAHDLFAVGSLTDVDGVRVGHHQRTAGRWLTGTTVVLAPAGAVAAVDVRGGGPGTRETDALDPRNLVDRVHAICLTGGSAYGLAAADGVMAHLERLGLGVPVGPGAREVVPVVPTAVIFDLGRGGDFGSRPDASFGERAVRNARARDVARGAVGAGTGARAGGLQGGVGMASTTVAIGDTEVRVCRAGRRERVRFAPRSGHRIALDAAAAAAPADRGRARRARQRPPRRHRHHR